MHAALLLFGTVLALQAGEPWKRHVVDNSSRGADGVRLLDVNGDGLPDITTGWEQGGVIRVYLNPGPRKAKAPWPAVTAGRVGAPEDAVFADLDGDGAVDVISSCEGNQKAIFVHWAPRNRDRYLEAGEWRTEALPAALGKMQWMFALPLQVDGRHGVDLVAGGKNQDAELGWFQAPEDPRRLAGWNWRPLRKIGWVMSLAAEDMDGDGDADLLFSDRKGERTGTYWLENPGTADGPWPEHAIGGLGLEVMFLATADLDGDGRKDVLSTAKPRQILFHQRQSADGRSWKTFPIRIPDGAGTAKAVRAGDIDLDGKTDLVFSCERAEGAMSGVMWLSHGGDPTKEQWKAGDISGPKGVKYDLVELIDLDGDGDLDVLTCEEQENLGVIWYENPVRP